MLVQLMSDIHFEFHRDQGDSFLASVEPKAEVLVLAGDIAVVTKSFKLMEKVFASFCSRWKHVLFVPGNHEYYSARASDIHGVIYLNLPERFPNLQVLHPGHGFGGDGKVVEIDGKRFLGATLWFPPPPPKVNKRGLTDFFAIQAFEPWVYEQHQLAADFLTQEVGDGDVVITHHLPSLQSVPIPFKGSDLNHFFAHDMEALIHERRPAVWLHGHTHTATRYQIGDTQVACNPLGYPREQSGFREDFVVDVG